VDLEHEGTEGLENRAELVAVVADQRAHDLVRGVVEREAAGRTGEGEEGRVRGDGVGAAPDTPLLEGVLGALGRGDVLVLDGRRGRGVLVGGHQY
jgi:hypothetical protein